MSKRPPPASGDAPGELAGRMAGEYRIGRKLGEGGFGTVYEAEHPLLKRRAAVKVLHRDAQQNADAVLRFVAEAQAVNQIRNPHFVDIFSFGQLEDGRHFYVMDLLEGEPLDRRLARVSRIDVVPALQLLRQVAHALDVAHGAGIVHRDLKPQNIFLTWGADGETTPKLLDFGMAKLLDDSTTVHTVTGTPVGTPLYMSPEQALGGKVDGRADVYALGVLTHELLTGQRPLVGDTLIAVLVAHINQPPPRVSEANADLPVELDEPILAMLRKNPEERPASAGEALAAVIRAAESAGRGVPVGLPHLPLPPQSPATQPTDGASRIASDPTMSSPGGIARSSAVATRPSNLRWVVAAILLALGSGVSYLVARGPSGQSVPSAAAGTTSDLGEPSSAPPATAAPSVSATVAAPRPSEEPGASSAASAASPTKLKRRGTPGPSSSAIPRDLESPF
jgi:serine/threonine-protein kinase